MQKNRSADQQPNQRGNVWGGGGGEGGLVIESFDPYRQTEGPAICSAF